MHRLTKLQGDSNLVMGSDEDPKDGGAVAGAVFGAVFIYIVRSRAPFILGTLLISMAGLLRVLWIPGLPPPPREPSWRDKPIISTNSETTRHVLYYTQATRTGE